MFFEQIFAMINNDLSFSSAGMLYINLHIFTCIAILAVALPIVINVPTRRLLVVETKDSFVL